MSAHTRKKRPRACRHVHSARERPSPSPRQSQGRIRSASRKRKRDPSKSKSRGQHRHTRAVHQRRCQSKTRAAGGNALRKRRLHRHQSRRRGGTADYTNDLEAVRSKVQAAVQNNPGALEGLKEMEMYAGVGDLQRYMVAAARRSGGNDSVDDQSDADDNATDNRSDADDNATDNRSDADDNATDNRSDADDNATGNRSGTDDNATGNRVGTEPAADGNISGPPSASVPDEDNSSKAHTDEKGLHEKPSSDSGCCQKLKDCNETVRLLQDRLRQCGADVGDGSLFDVKLKLITGKNHTDVPVLVKELAALRWATSDIQDTQLNAIVDAIVKLWYVTYFKDTIDGEINKLARQWDHTHGREGSKRTTAEKSLEQIKDSESGTKNVVDMAKVLGKESNISGENLQRLQVLIANKHLVTGDRTRIKNLLSNDVANNNELGIERLDTHTKKRKNIEKEYVTSLINAIDKFCDTLKKKTADEQIEINNRMVDDKLLVHLMYALKNPLKKTQNFTIPDKELPGLNEGVTQNERARCEKLQELLAKPTDDHRADTARPRPNANLLSAIQRGPKLNASGRHGFGQRSVGSSASARNDLFAAIRSGPLLGNSRERDRKSSAESQGSPNTLMDQIKKGIPLRSTSGNSSDTK